MVNQITGKLKLYINLRISSILIRDHHTKENSKNNEGVFIPILPDLILLIKINLFYRSPKLVVIIFLMVNWS